MNTPRGQIVNKSALLREVETDTAALVQLATDIFLFHYVVLVGRPDLELDPRNLLTLCIRPDCEHHVLLGYLGDYESYNPKVLGFVKACSSCQRLELNAT